MPLSKALGGAQCTTLFVLSFSVKLKLKCEEILPAVKSCKSDMLSVSMSE